MDDTVSPVDIEYSKTVKEWNAHVLDTRLVLIGNASGIRAKSGKHTAQTIRYDIIVLGLYFAQICGNKNVKKVMK